jgi:hypothetical protein
MRCVMRCVIGTFVIVGLVIAGLVAPASAALPGRIEFSSIDAVTRWISNYRAKPDPSRLPAAVRVLSQLGAFKDQEGAGVYVGFIAGIIGANRAKAEELIAKMASVAPADQWVIVRAIAYSGQADWKDLLRASAERMPLRKVMIEKYLDGQLQTLDEVALEKKNPTLWDKARGLFQSDKDGKPVEMTLDRSPELLDTLWGYYFATGSYGPIARIVALLPWANERDSVDKLTVGSMAKYTLASNAARDAELLAMLKAATKNQPKDVAPVLKEVIEAAETMDTTRVRKDALANIEELKRKGPGYRRDVTNWGQIGTGALALGCIVAATTGHVEFGLPCVIGGAASSAALSYWNNRQ